MKKLLSILCLATAFLWSNIYAQELNFSSMTPRDVCGDVTAPNINQVGGCAFPPVGGEVTCNLGVKASGQSSQFRMVVPALSVSTYKLTSVQLNFVINSWGGDFNLSLRRNDGSTYMHLLNSIGTGGSSNLPVNVTLCDTAAAIYPATAGAITGFYKPKTGPIGGSTHLGSTNNCGSAPVNASCSFHDFVPAGTNIGGNWDLVFLNGWGGETGNMTSWGMTFAAPPTLPNFAGVTVLPLAPGVCTPAPIACPVAVAGAAAAVPAPIASVPSLTVAPFNGGTAGTNVVAAAPAPAVSYILLSAAPPLPTTFCINAAATPCPAAGVVFTTAGLKHILWVASTGCGAYDTSYQAINILDTEKPTFSPACPVGGRVTLNAGPGECEVAWNAPAFTAFDNCPSTAGAFGAAVQSVGCTTTLSFSSVSGIQWGYMFDIRNTGAAPANIQGFPAWFMSSTGTASTSGNYEYWFKTAANESWKTGWVGVIGTPGSCPSGPSSPKSLWTLGKVSKPNMIRVNGFVAPTAANMDTFDVVCPVTDTILGCGGDTTFNVTNKGLLTLQPGETRGIYIAGAPGSNHGFIMAGFNSCANLAGYGTTILANVAAVAPNGIALDNPGGANLGGGLHCSSWGYAGNILYAVGGGNQVPVVQTCGAPYGPGCFFPVGCTTLCYTATDQAGNVATCTFDVCVNEFANATRALACNDDIQVSLDDSCKATIGADMVLEGGPYGCYDNYIVELRDWATNALVDRCSNQPGAQITCADIGREFKATIIDPVTGNKCWGHIRVEDKLAPRIVCPVDTCLPCGTSIDPSITGFPTVTECLASTCVPGFGCGYSLSYRDVARQGTCALGYDRLITRTWTATDASGNRGTCVQVITVGLGKLSDVTLPGNYDGLDLNMLLCNNKIDKVKNFDAHYYKPSHLGVECLDGYILDSVLFKALVAIGADPNYYVNDPFNFGARSPRVLGWNCIDDPADKNFGHPSPDPVYYPAHPSYDPAQGFPCWGPDVHVMWQGTGRPAANCRNLSTTYEDVVFNLAEAGCDAGPVGCYKVLRKWTVLDWCTGEIGGHSQIIKVADPEGPKVLYPDTILVNMEVWTCTGRWEVPPAWLVDNCSNEIHYTVEVTDGTVLGNEVAGYVVINLPEGVQDAWIIAQDCCGNITRKLVKLNVVDNVPPVPVCRRGTVIALSNNQSTGEGIAKLYAEDVNEGSFDNCKPHVYYKIIRMEELLDGRDRPTRNGVLPPYDNRRSCNGLNGDDHPGAAAPGNQVYFDDFTKFCCADVGQTIMVVLRVSDKNPGAGPIHPNTWTNISLQEGHFNDCMVEVEIQDKQPPVIVAPPDMVVSCWFWFDPSEAALENPNDATFGRIVTDLSSRRKVVSKDIVCHRYCEKNIHDYPGGTPGLPINSREAYDVACDFYYALFDTAHWDRKYELVWGQDGYALSTCAVAPEIDARNNIHCGQGSITRTFGFGTAWRNITASQTIYIVDCDPFWISGVCFDILDDITWGPNECSVVPTIPGCGPRDWSPDNPLLGRPKVVNGADDNCALIAIEYEDERFTVEPDACLKIIRTWTVIDWCQYDPTDLCWNGLGRWEYTEIIKVADTDAPVVSCGAPDCSGQGLATIDARTGLCVNHITLTASAFDSCSPVDWLKWEYKIDIWNDGKGIHGGYDYRVGSLTQKERAAGDTALVNHNDYADDRFNPFDASGTYPLGIHKIKWFVEDGCGNVGVCETLFEVKDCKKPTPYCLTGIITVPMPSTGCIDIWAVDLNLGSFDNCTPKDKLKFYFNGDKTATSRTICCEDFVAAGAGDELILDVEMWVEDEEGNTDFCKTQIIIQDVNDVCPNGGSFGKITGAIKTIKNDEAKSVNMELLKNGQMMKQGSGSPYAFLNLAKDVEYTVKPNRNDDHLNGVTTADIVKIQKHILGQEAITSPYLLIAADVNATNTITAADMSEIRKLILGVTSEFKSVKSWTFVPNSYVFADPTTPWSAPRTANVMLNAASKTADFYAIKMGDINENARAGVAGAATTRSAGTLNFEINDKAVQAGETYKVSFKSSDFNNISGYQFTMKFDASALTFEGVEAGSLKTTEGNFGLSRVSNGIITTSWNSNKGESYGADEVLFTVVFKANKSVNIGSAIAINSEVTTAEAYDVSLNAKNVKLSARTNTGVVETAMFELFQNEPNPFNKQTVVSFNLPTAAAATLTMYDVTGKVLRVYEIEGVKGVNTKVINKSDLNGNGVIYYQLDAANFTATKRMVVID